MSNALLCLSETMPFYAQDIHKDNFNYENTATVSCTNIKCINSLNTENMQISEKSSQDENKYANYTFKSGEQKTHKCPRKREATNILMECVKRRDNLRNIDFISNVPSFVSCNHKCDLNESSESLQDATGESFLSKKDSDLSQNFIYTIVSSSSMDLSDSSITDSGIEISSKSSSPTHSIDNIPGTICVDDDNCKEYMDIDATELIKPDGDHNDHSVHQTIGSSPAIYEDLNCLHLTDETVVCKEDKITVSIKSPIVESLFSNVSSVIYFSTKDEIVSAMPENILPLMKWKLSTITPVPIKEIVLKCGFHLVDADTTENWIGTWGKHLKCTSFRKIKNFQKVNHYPGSFHLGRKDRLWNNYKRMQNRFGEDDFNFFPETFLLPADMKSLKKTWENETDRCWIIKPPASARGTGVKVIHKWGQVPKNRPVVVQKYVSDPYLINGTKFDLRIYVLISSIEPLRVYVFEDGLVRFASEKYSLSNKSFSNRYIHLTNYSINRKSSSYTANEDENSCQGHKWSLKSFWSYMSSSGIAISKIQEAIMDMIIKTIISTEGPVCRLMKTYARSTYNCYELFGFDIMLDKDLRPWLLEVNISPSLHTRSLLDSSIKGQLVKDMLNIVGFQVPLISSPTASDDGMLSYSEIKQSSVRNRYLSPKEKKKHAVFTFQYADMKSDILEDLTPDDVRCLVESEDEFHRKGAFTRVFPSETSSKYFVYFEHIRYYNLLLDAWEKCYYKDRSRGISHLQELCNEKYHLQINMHYKDSNQMPTAESV